ncbi:MAG TPA: tRNA threonylcarbamoyladenosine dehydratase [Kiritimatiellia bacterium]|nr:tRNA threonylcarbamoyladenosine dehydratase [Kiritimatiellia bacterium]
MTKAAQSFSRVELLLGEEGFARLQASFVVVAGMGSVGSFAVESLARTGVGHLRLVDFDVVNRSNINRQLYALEATIGRKKVEIARERVMQINPACHVEALELFIDDTNVSRVLANKPAVVIDAIDSVNPKATLLAAAVEAGIPVVSAMGAATRTDPSCIHVADIHKTHGCPLARMIRKRLGKRGIKHGIRCIYSTEKTSDDHRLDADDPGTDSERTVDRGRKRDVLGSICSIPGIFGLIAAREAVFQILKGAQPCS